MKLVCLGALLLFLCATMVAEDHPITIHAGTLLDGKGGDSFW